MIFSSSFHGIISVVVSDMSLSVAKSFISMHPIKYWQSILKPKSHGLVRTLSFKVRLHDSPEASQAGASCDSPAASQAGASYELQLLCTLNHKIFC